MLLLFLIVLEKEDLLVKANTSPMSNKNKSRKSKIYIRLVSVLNIFPALRIKEPLQAFSSDETFSKTTFAATLTSSVADSSKANELLPSINKIKLFLLWRICMTVRETYCIVVEYHLQLLFKAKRTFLISIVGDDYLYYKIVLGRDFSVSLLSVFSSSLSTNLYPLAEKYDSFPPKRIKSFSLEIWR